MTELIGEIKEMETISKLELFQNCVNVNAVRVEDGYVFCWFHQDWKRCDGTKCAPSLRTERASMEW